MNELNNAIKQKLPKRAENFKEEELKQGKKKLLKMCPLGVNASDAIRRRSPVEKSTQFIV